MTVNIQLYTIGSLADSILCIIHNLKRIHLRVVENKSGQAAWTIVREQAPLHFPFFPILYNSMKEESSSTSEPSLLDLFCDFGFLVNFYLHVLKKCIFFNHNDSFKHSKRTIRFRARHDNDHHLLHTQTAKRINPEHLNFASHGVILGLPSNRGSRKSN